MEDFSDSEIEARVQIDPAVKKQLVQYGITACVFFILFLVLMCSVLISRKSWRNGLKAQLVSVYSEDSDCEVGDYEPVDTPFSVSCASYTLTKKNDNSVYHAVIIRVQTMFGPVPAVYTYREGDESADFVSFVTLNKRIESTVINNARYSQIAYWSRRIPSIIAGKDL